MDTDRERPVNSFKFAEAMHRVAPIYGPILLTQQKPGHPICLSRVRDVQDNALLPIKKGDSDAPHDMLIAERFQNVLHRFHSIQLHLTNIVSGHFAASLHPSEAA